MNTEQRNGLVGYACLNADLLDCSFKTCRIGNATGERLHALIDHNLNALEQIIDYNISQQIRLFRVSSDLIPFGSSSVNQLDWKREFSRKFATIRNKIFDHGIRISVHPGQYTVINSPNPDVVERAIHDLEYHADILEALGGNRTNKIILHIGGVYGDKQAAKKRFVDVYHARLTQRIKQHLIIENDDTLYHLNDVLEISSETGAPVVFDNLHHAVNPGNSTQPAAALIKLAAQTWSSQDGHQKIHYSQQEPGKKLGAHSTTIQLKEFAEFYEQLTDKNLDIMLEVKDKNRSAAKVNNLLHPDIRQLEAEWSRYKYLVLGKSQEAYIRLRHLLKDKTQPNILSFYSIIDEALKLPDHNGEQLNALMHVWGHLKEHAAEKEHIQAQLLLDQFSKNQIKLGKIKAYLSKLSAKYYIDYLNDSYYFNTTWF